MSLIQRFIRRVAFFNYKCIDCEKAGFCLHPYDCPDLVRLPKLVFKKPVPVDTTFKLSGTMSFGK